MPSTNQTPTCQDGGLDMKKLESVLDSDEFTYSVKDSSVWLSGPREAPKTWCFMQRRFDFKHARTEFSKNFNNFYMFPS